MVTTVMNIVPMQTAITRWKSLKPPMRTIAEPASVWRIPNQSLPASALSKTGKMACAVTPHAAMMAPHTNMLQAMR